MLCFVSSIGASCEEDPSPPEVMTAEAEEQDVEEPPVARERLGAPSPPAHFDAADAPRADAGELVAVAYQFNAPVYHRASAAGRVMGIVRRGVQLPVDERRFGQGCEGTWYRLEGGGYVCTRDGFAVSRDPRPRPHVPAERTRGLPYDYARVASTAARFYRPPTAEELARLAARDEDDDFPDVVQRWMEGDFFVALPPGAEPGDDLARTVRGHVLATEVLEPMQMPALVGSALQEGDLPMAFVLSETRPLYRLRDDGVAREVGTAEQYARLRSVREVTIGGQRYVVGPEGRALRREHVRIARAGARPERVGRGERWIAVDLDEQTLVAHDAEGRALFATLVSSGRDGYATPAGTFRLREKHVSITMTGEDPVDGPYEVEEVPWTMYYWRSYALHGAYWHDDFGEVRSHGCTNLSPVDARWLFDWTAPEVPAGWHGRRLRAGTWVSFTRGAGEAGEG